MISKKLVLIIGALLQGISFCKISFANDFQACETYLSNLQPSKFSERMLGIYHNFPDNIKSIMCKIKYRLVESDEFVGKYEYLLENGESVHVILFDSRFFLSEPIKSAEAFESSYFQNRFIHSPIDGVFEESLDVPRVRLEYEDREFVGSLEIVMLHELGHAFERMNLGKFKNWHKQNFLNNNQFRAALPVNMPFCYYRACDPSTVYPKQYGDEVVRQLFIYGFPTLYSAHNSQEGLADFFALYLSRKYLGLNSFNYLLTDGTVLDAFDLIDSQIFQKKLEGITDLFDSL